MARKRPQDLSYDDMLNISRSARGGSSTPQGSVSRLSTTRTVPGYTDGVRTGNIKQRQIYVGEPTGSGMGVEHGSTMSARQTLSRIGDVNSRISGPPAGAARGEELQQMSPDSLRSTLGVRRGSDPSGMGAAGGYRAALGVDGGGAPGRAAGGSDGQFDQLYRAGGGSVANRKARAAQLEQERVSAEQKQRREFAGQQRLAEIEAQFGAPAKIRAEGDLAVKQEEGKTKLGVAGIKSEADQQVQVIKGDYEKQLAKSKGLYRKNEDGTPNAEYEREQDALLERDQKKAEAEGNTKLRNAIVSDRIKAATESANAIFKAELVDLDAQAAVAADAKEDFDFKARARESGRRAQQTMQNQIDEIVGQTTGPADINMDGQISPEEEQLNLLATALKEKINPDTGNEMTPTEERLAKRKIKELETSLGF